MRENCRGVTLVETIVVIAILAAAGAAAVVTYTSMPGLKLEAEVRKIVSDIYWVRQRAIAKNEVYGLQFTLSPKQYALYKSPSKTTADFIPANSVKEGNFVTDNFFTVTLGLATANLWIYTPRGNMYLNDGSAQRDTIPFTNQGKTKNIRVFAETGNVKLE